MESKNLIASLQEEIGRVKKVVEVYEEVPKGAGMFAANLMKKDVEEGEKAISEMDTIEMIRALERLRAWEL